ncbi:MAG: hypothetical protein WBM07_10980 [Chitinivibrionales bacterium]
MALTKKTKICVVPGCGKEFQPTGNCQKRCPEHLSEKVLQLLIAAGFVTEEKVQQARALLK